MLANQKEHLFVGLKVLSIKQVANGDPSWGSPGSSCVKLLEQQAHKGCHTLSLPFCMKQSVQTIGQRCHLRKTRWHRLFSAKSNLDLVQLQGAPINRSSDSASYFAHLEDIRRGDLPNKAWLRVASPFFPVILLSRKPPQKPCGKTAIRFLKRTMVERNGQGINP